MSATNTTSIPKVEKESIDKLTFPNEEVLTSADEIKQRHADLEHAMRLGNIEHGKIKVHFKDSEGLKQVETTIWATTDKRIVLKGGIMIPINRICKVII